MDLLHQWTHLARAVGQSARRELEEIFLAIGIITVTPPRPWLTFDETRNPPPVWLPLCSVAKKGDAILGSKARTYHTPFSRFHIEGRALGPWVYLLG